MRLFICLLLTAVILCGDPGCQNNNNNPRYVLAVGNQPQHHTINTKPYVDALVYRTKSINEFSPFFKAATGVGPHKKNSSMSSVLYNYESSIDQQDRLRPGVPCQIDCLSTVEGVTVFSIDSKLDRYYSYGANAYLGCFDYQTKNTSDVETALKICTEINKFTYNQQFLKRVGKNETAAQYIVKKKLVGSFTDPTVLSYALPKNNNFTITDKNAMAASLYHQDRITNNPHKIPPSQIHQNMIYQNRIHEARSANKKPSIHHNNFGGKNSLAFGGPKKTFKLKYLPIHIQF
ncbi:recX [Acrasis kona]|uniref:RecX n=1 Tax=Acrasis kona TaxID=1008807 RepID=A0AAW2ZDS9_9EUKA